MNAYWEPPQDLTDDWVSLHGRFSAKASFNQNKLITYAVMVDNGAVRGTLDPSVLTVEPRSMFAEVNRASGASWWSVIRRLRSASKPMFVGIVRISVIVDNRGEPVVWTAPTCDGLNTK